MSQKIVDFYNVRPIDLKPGNVFVATLTCHISHIDESTDTVYIKVYRCRWEPSSYHPQMIPQGGNMGNDVEIAKTIFPVLNSFDHIKVL
jgi:hypothetical protein